MMHTLRTRWRWQRAHTDSIVVIEAVFQAPMFALNAVAKANACEPSHTLSKSPRRISPEPRRVRSVHHCARSAQWAECVRSGAVALDGRDAGQLQQLHRRKTGESLLAVSSEHNDTREMSEVRKKASKHEDTPYTRRQRAHTEAIVVIEAVFQAPMFALNAVAPLNAYEPSHTLSKSLRTIEDAGANPKGDVVLSLCAHNNTRNE
jgi:hypothetical protein